MVVTQVPEPSVTDSQGMHLQEAGVRSQRQILKPGTLTGNGAILTTRLRKSDPGILEKAKMALFSSLLNQNLTYL